MRLHSSSPCTSLHAHRVEKCWLWSHVKWLTFPCVCREETLSWVGSLDCLEDDFFLLGEETSQFHLDEGMWCLYTSSWAGLVDGTLSAQPTSSVSWTAQSSLVCMWSAHTSCRTHRKAVSASRWGDACLESQYWGGWGRRMMSWRLVRSGK